MTSFQISITPSRRAATRHITRVRRVLQKALTDTGVRQTDIARLIGVHRSVINREIRGQKDMTIGRVAELAWALGREPVFELKVPDILPGSNSQQPKILVSTITSGGTLVAEKSALHLATTIGARKSQNP